MEARAADATPMAAVDAANLALERGQPNVVTLAGLLAPGGVVDADGRPDPAALREVLAPRIARVPALHRVPVETGGEWMWRAAVPDLAHHIRVIDASMSFERTCARVVMTPVDPGRPLWELLLVPHADGDRCGMLFRLHHAVADGLGAEALVAALSDEAPGEEAAGARPSEPAPAARRPLLRRWGDLAVQTAAVFRRSVRSGVLLGPLGPTRDVAFLDVDLERLHDGAHRLGGTVGDAFLAAFGHGMRAMLTAAGETPPDSVPVSSPVRLARRAGEGNATGVMLIPIPVAGSDADADIAGSVARVASLTRSEKARARAVGTYRLMSNPRAARMLMHFARSQRAVGAIASELTGPPETLRLAGAELIAAWPLALLSGNVRVGALAVSYAGRFRVSIQTDASHLPPARVLADGMERALERIAAQA
ncbi:wax ester/triacylglycerol synthase domain-containing protein [Leifsonia virtsii]|uniref:diacylglycerol O-acyltransferase n=1 Tax=Leifsonia virtsii TaxID=3035915 RepID=A0ABT8J2L4_9MICO|nr:wax ester/triacylglycerol synthase domain-containing protein [Leifsonia virtsii]MDN4599113.1 wax ester/triacylglycerol synthase family O-acyltransferase [Leifsonia virtsii]